MRFRYFMALVVAASSAVGVAAAGSALRPAAQAAPGVYRISAGDTLYVEVPGETAFTQECQVSGAGTISYPMLGDVRAAGATCAELQARLQKRLRTYLRHPVVRVTVRQYGTAGMSVFVMGEVKNQGAYPLANGSGFLQAIAAAGGLMETASGQVKLLRPNTGEQPRIVSLDKISKAGSASQGPLLQPGDVLFVLRREEAKYSVLGEVPNPGMYDMPTTGTVHVLDALQKAGVLTAPTTTTTTTTPQPAQAALDDPSRLADYEHATLRQGQGTVQTVNVIALLRGDTSQNLVIKPGGVLTIPRRDSIKVFAVGEVRVSGRQLVPRSAKVVDLLNAAGGTTSTARPDKASVLRMVGGEPTSMPVDLNKLYGKGDMSQNVALKEGDVLYVPPKKDPRDPASVLRLLPYILAVM